MECRMGYRSPNLTVLCRSIRRVGSLLPRGQFHRRLTTAASAGLSTGVFTLRRLAGELAQIEGGVQIAVQDLAAVRVLTLKRPVRQRQVLIYPAASRAGLARRLPARGQYHLAAIPGGFVQQLPPELPKAHIRDGLRQVVVLEHAGDMQVFDDED